LGTEAPDSVVAAIGTRPINIHLHHYSAALSQFAEGGVLDTGFFEVLGWNFDRNGAVSFASIVEATEYPIFGSQFHPEKNCFEWDQSWEEESGSQDVHSTAAIEVSQYLARFFVDQCRQNSNLFQEGSFPLIYEFQAVHHQEDKSDFEWEQAYFW
jgi:gamma-glutamyl hydrolase